MTQDGAYDENSCTPTGSDIEGPFHLPNAPIRNNSDLYGDVGTTLILQGQLFAQDASGCRTPISGTIDFCMQIRVETMTIHSSDMKYRGLVQTDAQGFELTTLFQAVILMVHCIDHVIFMSKYMMHQTKRFSQHNSILREIRIFR